MMSTKWTFSFLTLMLVGLLIAAPMALANKITLRVKDANRDGAGTPDDVSVEDGIQVLAGARVQITLKSEEPINGASIDIKRISPINNVNGDFEIDGAWVAATPATPESTTGIVRVNAKEYTINFTANDQSPMTAGKEVTLWVVPRAFTSATTGDNDSTGASIKFKYVAPDSSQDSPTVDEPNPPKVVSITRATAIGSTVDSAFIAEVVEGEFLVKIVLTEKPNGGLASAKLADRIKALSVSAGTVTNVVPGVSFAREPAGSGSAATSPPESEGNYNHDGSPADPVPQPTGRDAKYYPYLATIMPDGSKDEVIIQVNDFKDLVKTQGEGTSIIEPGMYRKPSVKAAEGKLGREILKVKVKKKPAGPKTAGFTVAIPNDIIIPANGYLVVAKDDGDGDDNHEKRTDSTAIVYPGDPKDSNIMDNERQPAQRLYNVIKADLLNLEGFLISGGTIVLLSGGIGVESQLHISEIMWGTDASLSNPVSSQWIEIRNPLDKQLKTKDTKLVFYGAGASDQAAVKALDSTTVSDIVGTVGDNGYWSIVGKGRGGRTGVGEAPGDLIAVTPTLSLISMQRAAGATGGQTGTMESSWAGSIGAPLNFDLKKQGLRIGTPGAPPTAYPDKPTPEPDPVPPVVIPGATATDIMITEIMVDTGDGRLPQWIELTNVSEKEVSLKDWALLISNAAADADVEGGSLEIDLSAYTLGVRATPNTSGNNGQSLLLVGGTARTSGNLAGNDRVVNITSALGAQGRYTFLSPMGFMIKLLPPQTTGVLAYGDTAGNLGAAVAWDIKMDETGRSSLIRLNDATGMVMDGTAENGWKLASSTSLVDGPATWVGSDEDAGTPGYDSGGPLPVELSHFRPARDKATGQVVITWATQSELNNAGFFIKRAQQRDGEFKVINATMIAGAGTTSEKQFYTYTDTTAQPNIVYYYQIEDVSLDGQRQTLTRGIRLKGHIGAAGKLTATWGELKTSNE